MTSLCTKRKNKNYAVDDSEVAALTKIKILFVATSALVVPLKQKQIVNGKHQICVVKMKMTQQMNVVARAKEILSRTTQNAESRSLNKLICLCFDFANTRRVAYIYSRRLR